MRSQKERLVNDRTATSYEPASNRSLCFSIDLHNISLHVLLERRFVYLLFNCVEEYEWRTSPGGSVLLAIHSARRHLVASLRASTRHVSRISDFWARKALFSCSSGNYYLLYRRLAFQWRRHTDEPKEILRYARASNSKKEEGTKHQA